jgi:type IX secretion system PorP/SprF family membrane protein
MRSVKKIGVFLLCLINCFTVDSQDIHWSQFNDNPVFQNPANSGRFKGDYRIHANYRDQWRSVTLPFSTFSFSGDMKLSKIPKLGIGALFFHDQAGDGKFKTMEFQLTSAYAMKLSSDSVHNIRLGLQMGMNHRQVNMTDFSFDAQFDGTIYNAGLPTNENYVNQRNTNFSIGTGLVYEWLKEDRKRIIGGISLFNINQPNQGFYGQKVQRDRRLNLFARGQFALNYDWDILPTFQFNLQGKYKELIIGSNVRYILLDRLGEYRAVYFGAFYRNKDAGYLSAGVDYQNWFAGVSYDLNFSKLLPASNVRGGIEVSVRYIITRFNPKKVLHRVCPDYI